VEVKKKRRRKGRKLRKKKVEGAGRGFCENMGK
jgi:hypothetical protein